MAHVTLQINLAPSDYAHAQHLLAHQIRTWRTQVDEVLLTIDYRRSPGRFSARWEEGLERIGPLARSFRDARVVEVSYEPAVQSRVSNAFFGGDAVPAKDFRGGPYYAYFFGLLESSHDYVLHIDADMFFGGGSATWLAEAIAYLEGHPQVLFCAPLSGPPRSDNRLAELVSVPDPGCRHMFHFRDMSTRLFLFSRQRFGESIGPLRPRRPPAFKNSLIAWLDGNPPQDLPEHLISAAMQARGLQRTEFLGSGQGMWSLHPPYRGADFYRRLPELISRIETGDIPAAQHGHHDLNDSMVDWSEGRAALRSNRAWTRFWRRLVSR